MYWNGNCLYQFMRATSTKKKNRRRLLTWLLIIPAILITGALMSLWYWNTHKKSIIRKKLENAIREKTDGLYKLQYDSMALDEMAGDVSLYNLHLRYDTARYLLTEQNGTAPPVLFSIDIPEINIEGIKTGKAIKGSEIIGKKLEIKDPVIDLYYTYKGKDSLRNTPTREVYEQILGGIKLLQVDTVLLSGAVIRTKSIKTGKMIVEGTNINLSLFNVRIDSNTYADSSRFLFAEEVDAHIGSVNWTSDDKLYNYKGDSIAINSRDRSISMNKFVIKPLLGEDAFVNAIPFQDDRFDLSFSGMHITGVDTKTVLDERLEADAMLISSSIFKVYRDLARPRDNKSRVGHYPQQVMDHIPFRFTIKKVNINDSYVEYKERNDISRQSGRVSFHHMNATLTNFTNDKKAAGQEMVLVANARFLDQTSFTSKWKFYLFHPNGRFDVSGNVGPIPGRSLNVIAEPTGPSHIREGQMNGLEFILQGHDHGMQGSIQLLYDNLKIDLMEKDNATAKPDKKFLTSLVANILIKNSNPKKNEPARKVNVSITRDANRSFFWLCWQTIYKGIRETIGAPDANYRIAAKSSSRNNRKK